MKQIENNLKFIEAERRARFALKQIMSYLTSNQKYKYDIFYCLEDSIDAYDCYLGIYTLEGKLVKRYFIETKIRNEHYPELIYEKKKHNSLLKLINDLDPDNSEILYISFTPKGTYIFNTMKMDLQVSKLECNKKTVLSTSEKINKDVYFLNITDARRIDYIYNEQDYLNSLKVVVLKDKPKIKGIEF